LSSVIADYLQPKLVQKAYSSSVTAVNGAQT